jgi:dCTP deaminase
MILGRDEIIRLVRKGIIEIDPFQEDAVGPASVDLTLGNDFRVFKPSEIELFSNNFDPAPYGELIHLDDHEFIELKPGDFVLGITRERIKLPSNIMGLLSGRSRFARAGLMVHISSNIVHPGSNNHQVLEIANLGRHILHLYPGIRICQIVFMEVKGGEPLTDRYSHQTEP